MEETNQMVLGVLKGLADRKTRITAPLDLGGFGDAGLHLYLTPRGLVESNHAAGNSGRKCGPVIEPSTELVEKFSGHLDLEELRAFYLELSV